MVIWLNAVERVWRAETKLCHIWAEEFNSLLLVNVTRPATDALLCPMEPVGSNAQTAFHWQKLSILFKCFCESTTLLWWDHCYCSIGDNCYCWSYFFSWNNYSSFLFLVSFCFSFVCLALFSSPEPLLHGPLFIHTRSWLLMETTELCQLKKIKRTKEALSNWQERRTGFWLCDPNAVEGW